MKTFLAARRAVVILMAASLLAACASPPALVSGPSPEQRGLARNEARAGDDLLYTGAAQYVEVYSYPAGELQQSFTITGNVNGMCSDSEGDVFVTAAPPKASKSTSGFVYQYAHGGKTPIATLKLPGHGIPVACSSDPTTGNLAVTVQDSRDYAPSVAIYAKAAGTPKIYQSDAIGAYPQLAYDGSGDLACDQRRQRRRRISPWKAQTPNNHARSDAGRRQAPSMGRVALGAAIVQRAQAQPREGPRANLSRADLRIERTGRRPIKFEPWLARDPGQSWIEGTTIVATPFSSIYFWTYPAGGMPIKAFRSSHHVKAITISS